LTVSDRTRIDWNLVPALDALLTERNVSRAARRVGISQPAASGALGRLRRHFGDELLVRRGQNYLLTPLAERLAPLARQAVAATAVALASASDFDPQRCSRDFTLAASEYVQAVLAPLLVAEVRRRAPEARLNFVAPFTEPFRTGLDVIQATDGWLAPPEVLHGQRHTGLLADRWVCVVAETNQSVGETLTLEDVRGAQWVAPTVRGEPLRFQLDGLSAHGIEPRIVVTTESFLAVPFLVAGTDYVGVVQESLARRLADAAGVRIHACPWSVQALNLTLWWDQKWEADPAHAWLRGVVDETMVLAGQPRQP
jgi:DNA-binding transcriptional LysR family regulator